MRRQTSLVALAVVACALASSTGQGGAARSSFPCRWTYNMYAGLRAGYVTAGENADCTGRRGKLTLSAHLDWLNPKTRGWRVDRAQTRTWTNLGGLRYLSLAEHCKPGKFRATFLWTLRDSGQRVLATNSIHTGSLTLPSADCKLTLRKTLLPANTRPT